METDENELLILFRDGETKKNFARAKKFSGARAGEDFSKFATKKFDKKDVTITERT